MVVELGPTVLWLYQCIVFVTVQVRQPSVCRYELKDTQFHFEAGKNNNLLRTLDRMDAAMKSQSQELSRSQPDLSTMRTRAYSFSWPPHWPHLTSFCEKVAWCRFIFGDRFPLTVFIVVF